MLPRSRENGQEAEARIQEDQEDAEIVDRFMAMK
jgi:hypothetical protein